MRCVYIYICVCVYSDTMVRILLSPHTNSSRRQCLVERQEGCLLFFHDKPTRLTCQSVHVKPSNLLSLHIFLWVSCWICLAHIQQLLAANALFLMRFLFFVRQRSTLEVSSAWEPYPYSSTFINDDQKTCQKQPWTNPLLNQHLKQCWTHYIHYIQIINFKLMLSPPESMLMHHQWIHRPSNEAKTSTTGLRKWCL